jgi:hypothetical protein
MVVKQATRLDTIVANKNMNQLVDLPMGTLKHGISNPL